VKDLKKLTHPDEKEIECIKDFFYDKIYDSVSISADVIIV
jgi:hypothetical protein